MHYLLIGQNSFFPMTFILAIGQLQALLVFYFIFYLKQEIRVR